jgi:CelD/BcsL family acetyltransferase involved in cellulose biosynthesis
MAHPASLGASSKHAAKIRRASELPARTAPHEEVAVVAGRVRQLRGAGEIAMPDVPGPEWDALVEETPGAEVSHLGAWAQILREAYGYEPLYLALAGPDGLDGGLPLVLSKGLVSGRRLRSLPFLHGAGPLATTHADRQGLLAAAAESGARRGALVVVHAYDRDLGELDPRFHRMTLPPKWVVELGEVPALDPAAWKKPSLHLVRSLRKSDAAGLTVAVSDEEADLRAFYRLYLDVMRRRRVLPRPYRQLELSRRHLPDGVFRLFVARRERSVVAAAVCYAFRDTVEIHYSASDSRQLDARPNHRLWWGVLEWAAENGFRRVDLGEAKPGSALEDFKRQFLATPKAEYRYDFSSSRSPWRRKSSDSGGQGRLRTLAEHPVVRQTWALAPLAVTQVAGTIATRYV